jgi:hypothetical protein
MVFGARSIDDASDLVVRRLFKRTLNGLACVTFPRHLPNSALKTEVAVIARQHSLAWTNRGTFDATNSAIRIACDRRCIES